MAGQVTDTERPFLGVQCMKQCLPNLSLKSVQRSIVCLGEGINSAFSTGEGVFLIIPLSFPAFGQPFFCLKL